MNQEQACEILGVDAVADLSTIRLQFRRLASRSHPDRFLTADEKAEATQRFQEIAEAFSVLRKHAGDSDDQVDLDDAPPVETEDGEEVAEPATTWSSWTASATKGPIGHASFVDEGEESRDRQHRAWAALLPPLIASPSVEMVLDLVLLPSHLATALSSVLTRTAREELILSVEVSGLVGTLVGHLIPAMIGLTLGYLVIDSPGARTLSAIAFGCWWVTSAILSSILDPPVTSPAGAQDPRPR